MEMEVTVIVSDAPDFSCEMIMVNDSIVFRSESLVAEVTFLGI